MGVIGVLCGSAEVCCVPDGGVGGMVGIGYVRRFVLIGERLLICRICLLCCVSTCWTGCGCGIGEAEEKYCV